MFMRLSTSTVIGVAEHTQREETAQTTIPQLSYNRWSGFPTGTQQSVNPMDDPTRGCARDRQQYYQPHLSALDAFTLRVPSTPVPRSITTGPWVVSHFSATYAKAT